MRRIVVDEATVDQRALEAAVRVIADGGIVAMPTDTLYGLAVDPFNVAAVERLFAMKGRSAERALPLVASDIEQVTASLGVLPPLAARLAAAFWPGPLTLLIVPPVLLPDLVTGGTARVGVRVPRHRVTRLLCRACGVPLTATSANISGDPPSADPDEIARHIGGRIDLLLDAGVTPGGAPSTIVDATGEAPLLVRAGAIEMADITTQIG